MAKRLERAKQQVFVAACFTGKIPAMKKALADLNEQVLVKHRLFSPLSAAAASGNPAAVTFLIEQGASIEKTGAAAVGHAKPATLAILAAHGALEQKDGLYTPLYLALVYGSFTAAKRLLALGAKVDHDSLNAALNGDARDKTVPLVLAYGADINAVSSQARGESGETLLGLRAMYGDLRAVKLLLEHGADPNVRGARGKVAIDLATNKAVIALLRKGKVAAGPSFKSKSKIAAIAAIENALELELPKRFAKFVANTEWKRYPKARVTELPHYDTTNLAVRFDVGMGLLREHDVTNTEGIVGLARLVSRGDEEPQFLAVDLRKASCPVLMWEHEDGELYPAFKSLDSFLRETESAGKPGSLDAG